MRTWNQASAAFLAAVLATILLSCEQGTTDPANTLPAVSIESPADGSTFVEGDTITFSGSAKDAEDGKLTGLALVWTSDMDGELGTGSEVFRYDLSVGHHAIVLTAEDSRGSLGSDTVIIDNIANEPPTVSIHSPADGSTYVVGDTIPFHADAVDPEDGLLSGTAVAWSSSVSGQFATDTAASSSQLLGGRHVVTARAIDSRGLTAFDSAVMDVFEVTVSPDSAAVMIGDSVQFSVAVRGGKAPRVRWQVRDIGDGSEAGVIDSTGLYTAPQYPPQGARVLITAAIEGEPRATDSAVVRVLGPIDRPFELWRAYIDPPYGNRGFVEGITFDENGNAYAAGYVSDRNTGGSFRAVVASLDPVGQRRWVYASETGDRLFRGVLAADSASVMAFGQGHSSSWRALLVTLDSDGGLVQEAMCNGDEAQSLTAGSRGADDAYFVGGGGILKSDLLGNLHCGSPTDVAVDDLSNPVLSGVLPVDGGLVVAGSRQVTNHCWHPGAYVFVQKIVPPGPPVWRFDFGSVLGSTGTFVSQPSITSAAEGGEQAFYLVGEVTTSYGEDCRPNPPDDYYRIMTARLTADGRLDWVSYWTADSEPACHVGSEAIVPDPAGGAIIAGYGGIGCRAEYYCAAASYSPNGALRWTLYPGFQGETVLCTAAAVSPDGRFLYLGGGMFDQNGRLIIAKYALP